MKRLLLKIKQALSLTLSVVLVASLIVLTLDVLWGVFSRYVLGSQSPWTEELARLLLVWVTMLGGALAFGEGAHLGVDLIAEKLETDARRIVEVAVQLLCVFFAAYVMILGGGRLTLERLDAGQMLPAMQVSRAWVYVSVPVAGVLITAYGIESLLRLTVGGVDPSRLHRRAVDV